VPLTAATQIKKLSAWIRGLVPDCIALNPSKTHLELKTVSSWPNDDDSGCL